MQDHDDEDNNHDHENDDSDDERQLATLVLLLLRPPIPPKRTGDGNNDNAGENHPSTNNAGAQDGDEGAADAMTENTMTSSPPSTLQLELEKDECRLLCFVGRLIHGYRAAYTAAATATRTVSPWPTNQLSPPDEGRSHCKEDAPSTNPSICFIQSAYLKLAVRILYLRYHDPHSDYYHDKNDDRAAADEVRTHEECLFLILLRAFQTRCDRNAELEQVDVEMAWTLHGLLLRFFRRLLTNKEEDDCAVSSSLNNHRDDDEDDSRELQSNNSSFWVSLIDSLLTRRRRQRLRSGEGMVQMTTAESVEAVEKVASRKARMNRDDSETQQQQQTGEKVDDPTMAMAQTLHSIVDHHSHRVLGVPLDAMPTMASMSVSTATAIATANDDSQIDANNHKAEQNVDRENPTKECLETKRRHYWDDQFDRTIVTCLQSFLRVCSSSSTGSHPSCSDESCWLLSRQSLLELILWSQARLVYGSDGDGEEEGKSQRSSSQYSLDIYHFTLQYLRQCCRLCYQNRHVITGPPTTLTSSSSSSSTNDPCRSLYEMCVARDCNRVNDVDASYPLNTDRSQITEAAHAIRSFVFYGVIVLSNEHAGPRSVQLENLAEGNVKEGNGTKAYNSPFRDANLLRWEIHELILELWQSIGPEWLYASPNSTQLCSSTSTTTLDDEPSFWWFSSTSFDQTPFAASRRKKGQSGHGHDNPQKLGKTWPLCLLIRLAAGEFRLQLGRWVDCSHSKNNDEKSVGGDNEGRDYELFEEDVSSISYPNHSTIINTIESHARIVVQSVHLMMSLAGEENEVSDAMVTDEKDPEVWTANSILHVRNSLEDALDSSIQYFVMVSDDLGSGMVPTKDVNSPDLERIIRTCSMVLGTIASELELDYLLSISVSCKNSDGTYNKMIGPENVNDETTEFAIALRSALSFCHDLGKNRISQQFEEMNAASRWEEYEPMVYLLPCIMSLTTTIASDQEDTNEVTTGKALATLTFLSKDCFLVHLISSLLHRMLEYWKNFIIHRDEGKIDNDSILSSRANTTLSLVRMCAALTEMLVISGSWIVSKHEIRVLHDSLQAWRKELAARSQQKLISLVDLRDDIESTMVHISDIQTIFH